MALSQVKLLLLSVLLVNVVSTTPIHEDNEDLDWLSIKRAPNTVKKAPIARRGVHQWGGPYGGDVLFPPVPSVEHAADSGFEG